MAANEEEEDVATGASTDAVMLEDVEESDEDDEAGEELSDLNPHHAPLSASRSGTFSGSYAANFSTSKGSPAQSKSSPSRATTPSSATSTYFSPTRLSTQHPHVGNNHTEHKSSPNSHPTPNGSKGAVSSVSKFASPKNPKSAESPSISTSLQDADFSFASLTSPQDSELLRRKRAAPKRPVVPLPHAAMRRNEDQDEEDLDDGSNDN